MIVVKKASRMRSLNFKQQVRNTCKISFMEETNDYQPQHFINQLKPCLKV